MNEIDVMTAKSWIDSGEATIIDVRENDEYIAEHIEGSQLNPLSQFNPMAIKSDGRKILLLCRSGRRSAEAFGRLRTSGIDAYNVQGGILAWKQAGYGLSSEAKAPISIMRQVQITAGSIVFLGVLLGFFINPYFYFLSAFVGAGLVFAGVTGTCGLAIILSAMPWNRAFQASSKTCCT